MKKLIAIASGAAIALFLAWNNVYVEPTDEDRSVIANLFSKPTLASYEDEIRTIREVQGRVFSLVKFENVPTRGKRREVSDLVGKSGLCYDRARFIEMVLRAHGLATRRVAIYSTNSILDLTLKRKLPSHAMLEVKTRRGWLLVDTIKPWLAVSDGAPASIASVGSVSKDGLHPDIQKMLSGEFTYVYGLYSRHGYYHAPFIPFPDVNWSELVQNIV